MEMSTDGAFKLKPGLDEKAMGAELQKLASAYQVETKFAGAAGYGSREAYSTIAAAQASTGPQSVKAVIEQASQQQKERDEEQIRIGREGLEEMKKKPKVRDS